MGEREPLELSAIRSRVLFRGGTDPCLSGIRYVGTLVALVSGFALGLGTSRCCALRMALRAFELRCVFVVLSSDCLLAFTGCLGSGRLGDSPLRWRERPTILLLLLRSLLIGPRLIISGNVALLLETLRVGMACGLCAIPAFKLGLVSLRPP